MTRKVAHKAPALARAATSKTKRSRVSTRAAAASSPADALLAYGQKRDFAKTAEPKGRSLTRRPATASVCRSTTRRGSITI